LTGFANARAETRHRTVRRRFASRPRQPKNWWTVRRRKWSLPTGFSEAGIREALRDARDPEIGRDLVSLNMIRSIGIDGPGVTVGVALTTAGCRMKHMIATALAATRMRRRIKVL
jgi:hypothetical protein